MFGWRLGTMQLVIDPEALLRKFPALLRIASSQPALCRFGTPQEGDEDDARPPAVKGGAFWIRARTEVALGSG